LEEIYKLKIDKSDKIWSIEFLNYTKYKHKDAYSSEIRPATGGPSGPLRIDKNRIEENINTITSDAQKISNLKSAKNCSRIDPLGSMKVCKFNFEKAYEKYPRKEGKTRGMKSCINEIKNQDDYNNLLLAIENYSMHCKNSKIEYKYTKIFSTFMNEWRDWVAWVEIQSSTRGRSIEELIEIEKEKLREGRYGENSFSGAVG
jgi:hypothetical protein